MSASADTIDTVQVMLRQEADYATGDLPYPTTFNTNHDSVDEAARAKMVEWCCRVVGYCKLQTETVFISMNYTDRMSVQNPSILNSRAVYQLVAMTSLYTAAKIHAPEAMDPKLVSNLSRGTYTVDEIEEQERQLVSTLQWRLNPPTAHSFVRQYLALFSPALTRHELEAATLFALQQIDVYGCNHHCSTAVRQSVIAYCAVINALEHLPRMSMSEKRLALMGYNLGKLIGIDRAVDETAILEAQCNLMSAVQRTQLGSTSPRDAKRIRICEPVSETKKDESHQSPRLISER